MLIPCFIPKANGASRPSRVRVYISAYEQITGRAFDLPDPNVPVLERIRKNLKKYF